MSKIEFEVDDIEELQRKPEIEGKIGTPLYFSGERSLQVLAATEHNPKWMARRKIIMEGWRRLVNQGAKPARVREFLSPHLAEALIIGCSGWKSKGVEIPYSPEFGRYLMLNADDAYASVFQIMDDTTRFRGEQLEVVVDEGKGSSTGTTSTPPTSATGDA